MQPPLLIDWLRQLHLNADAGLAAKRWKLAESAVEQVARGQLIQLIRVFLFPATVSTNGENLTSFFLEHDSEFPATNNSEELRLMGGVLMIAAFEKRPLVGNSFALGIKAAAFPAHRVNPPQRAIVEQAGKYLDVQANTLRPDEFRPQHVDFAGKFAELVKAVVANDAAQITELSNVATSSLFAASKNPVERLAEEVGLLWWLIGAFSPSLNSDVSGISANAYALIAAAEAFERTRLLPPPPSIGPILGRALGNCKGAKEKSVTLKDFIGAVDAKWREKFVSSHLSTEVADLVPITTALTKLEDTGDLTLLPRALQKACPGVALDLPLLPSEAARQFYNELAFLKTLNAIV